MPNYRRMRVGGGCWFFTVNLRDRRRTLLTAHIVALREAVAKTRQTRPFTIDAFVVLPDHLHAIWTLPPDDDDFPTRWRLIKTRFAKSVHQSGTAGEVWQPRFWEHLIRGDSDYENHVNYCYINPVKHRLVDRVCDWPHSSFHRDVRSGLFPQDWAGDMGSYGER